MGRKGVGRPGKKRPRAERNPTGQELFVSNRCEKAKNPTFSANGLHTMATAMATRMADTGPSTMEIEVRMGFSKIISIIDNELRILESLRNYLAVCKPYDDLSRRVI